MAHISQCTEHTLIGAAVRGIHVNNAVPDAATVVGGSSALWWVHTRELLHLHPPRRDEGVPDEY